MLLEIKGVLLGLNCFISISGIGLGFFPLIYFEVLYTFTFELLSFDVK